jgi:large subunit ribosomal protein L10
LKKIFKNRVVKHYEKLLKYYDSLLFIRNNRLTAENFSSVRTEFKKYDNKLLVIKNTLAKIAIRKSKFSSLEGVLSGSVALACAQDLISVTKILFNFQKKSFPIEIMGGFIQGKIVKRKDIIKLSSMLSSGEVNFSLITLLMKVTNKIILLTGISSVYLARTIKIFSKQLLKRSKDERN